MGEKWGKKEENKDDHFSILKVGKCEEKKKKTKMMAIVLAKLLDIFDYFPRPMVSVSLVLS